MKLVLSLMVSSLAIADPAPRDVPMAMVPPGGPNWDVKTHPRPQWVKEIETTWEDKTRHSALVDSLTLSRQIEFAAFQVIDWEPPNLEWAVQIGRRRGAKIAPVLKSMLASEPSDEFAETLVEIAGLMVGNQGANIGDAGRRPLYDAAKRRVMELRDPARRDQLKLDLAYLRTGDPNAQPEGKTASDDEEIKSPSLLELLTHPERFVGCLVEVDGFFGDFTIAGAKLYLSREDRIAHGSLFGTVRLSFLDKAKSVRIDRGDAMNGKFVSVRGRFIAATQREEAHIAQITRFGVSEYPGLFEGIQK